MLNLDVARFCDDDGTLDIGVAAQQLLQIQLCQCRRFMKMWQKSVLYHGH